MKGKTKFEVLPASPHLHGTRLGYANRLTRALLEIAGTSHPAESDGPPALNERVLSLVAIACLFRRNLLPATVAGKIPDILSGAEALDEKRLTIDSSTFATNLFEFLSIDFGWLNKEPLIVRKTRDLFCKPEFALLLEDPLLAGWVWQCLSRQPRSKIIAPADAKASGLSEVRSERAAARDISLSFLPALTQWFTPPWIADFLVRRALQDSSASAGTESPRAPARRLLNLIDPACGAGHILVPALGHLTESLIKDQRLPVQEALATVLEQGLFGLDIDRPVLELAGLSIYLAARDILVANSIDKPIDLPAPCIYYFESTALSQANPSIGSLWLGVEPISPHLFLAGPRGRSRLTDSPLTGKFSVVVTNPPFLGHRLIPPDLAAFLKRHYRGAHFDLYAAFLALGLRVLEGNGSIAVVCQQSFMSITRYEELRRELLVSCDVTALVQLGSGAFGHVSGEKLNSAIIVARKKASSNHASQAAQHANTASPSVKCWRFLESSEKLSAETLGIESQPHIEVDRSQFGTASGAAFTFWCPAEIARLFDRHPPLQSAELGINCTNGLFTCNNDLFVADFRAVDPHDRSNWVPYDKGGGHKWYRTTPHMLNWKGDGKAIRAYRVKQGQSASLPGERFYFKPGITYSYIGTKGFRARLLSPGSIFDIASSAVFSESLDLLYILGFLNSALARFLLGLLNPTINFQIGDVRRLPFAQPDPATYEKVRAATGEAVELARQMEQFDPESPAYTGPPLLRYCARQSPSMADLQQAYRRHCQLVENANARESSLQAEIDTCIFSLYGITESDQERIFTDPWVTRSERKLAGTPSFQSCLCQLQDETMSLRKPRQTDVS